jgi:hypothetical protein
MRAETWQLLHELWAKHPCMRAAEGAPMSEIEAAALRLEIALPADYVEFVHRIGGAMVGPYPVYGFRAAEVMDQHTDLVSLNEHYRAGSGVSPEWLVVSDDHAGNPFAVLPTGKVVRPDHDFGGVDEIADSFEGFLHYCLRGGA